ncbi:hypothetical protein F2Q69_00002376 [Brassica cretica]|uniref:Uncharacterized protein n=1 Tax=Brassica cretica TaxID=69181 RepID=A0A8S9NTM0_BRACR|nr:hypothetical protein F2Q69_00002376 [Brassica cretica]
MVKIFGKLTGDGGASEAEKLRVSTFNFQLDLGFQGGAGRSEEKRHVERRDNLNGLCVSCDMAFNLLYKYNDEDGDCQTNLDREEARLEKELIRVIVSGQIDCLKMNLYQAVTVYLRQSYSFFKEAHGHSHAPLRT